MADFSISVRRYMSEPVQAVAPGAPLAEVHARLRELDVSSLAVTEGDRLVGVISRTDLLRVGRRKGSVKLGGPLLELPDRPVSDVMTREVLSVAPDSTVARAAAAMLKHHYHRVFVTEGERPIGVFSTRDVMAVVRDQRDETLVGQHMTSPLMTYAASSPVGRAMALLEGAGIGGLVIVEDDWPVGMFTQVEALLSQEVDAQLPVEEVMNDAFVCLPVSTRMHRAASQALTLKTRRIITVENAGAVGMLTGIDFARSAAR
jgi:CBS domain-containing protein